MNDKIEKFRSYIDDEMDTVQKSSFEKALSSIEREELEGDLLIRKMLLESSRELPKDYLENLNAKIETAYQEVFTEENLQSVQKKHSLKSVMVKFKEFAIEFFETFKSPKYAMGLICTVIVIAIAVSINMNEGLFVENSFYKRVSGEMSLQQGGSTDGFYEYDENNYLNAAQSLEEAVDSGAEKMGMSSGNAKVAPKSEELKRQNKSEVEESVDTVATDTDFDKNMKADFVESKGKKIIYNAHLEIETENYDEFEESFERTLSLFGALVDFRNIRSYRVEEDGVDKVYKHVEIAIRVDSKNFFELLSEFQSVSDVINESVSSEDITLIYHDTTQKKKNLEAREAALLKLMEKAQTMEDIITVDREISMVRDQIEAYGDRLIKWDDQVKYSTIRIYVTEVEQKKPRVKPIPKNFGEKMADTFIVSINNIIYFAQNMVLLFIYNIINIILVIIVIAVVIGVVKKYKKKKS